jgi:hypothetical protein
VPLGTKRDLEGASQTRRRPWSISFALVFKAFWWGCPVRLCAGSGYSLNLLAGSFYSFALKFLTFVALACRVSLT